MHSDRKSGADETVAASSHSTEGADPLCDYSVDKARITTRPLRAVILHPPHLRRTGLVALLVGIWLTVFNQGAQLLAGPWDASLAIKFAMNVLTPFVVANLGLVSRQGEPEAGATK